MAKEKADQIGDQYRGSSEDKADRNDHIVSTEAFIAKIGCV